MFRHFRRVPLVDAFDSWVIYYDSWYYMTFTESSNVTILRSQILTDWNQAEAKLAFSNTANTSYA
jgi:hypothetical protein